LLLLAPAARGAQREALGKGPIVITAESLSADQKAGVAHFEGSVVAKSEEMTLMADRMTVFYAEDGGVRKIDAEGAVKLIRGGQVVTAEHAVYTARDQTAVFTGNPRAVEGQSVVTGTRMTYMMAEDRFVVQDSRVFLEGKDAPPAEDD
jgi:lipopolysaccharide export system protein LptA